MKIRAVVLFLAFLLPGVPWAQQAEPATPPWSGATAPTEQPRLEAGSAGPQALSLTLDDAVKLGLENSPQVKMAEANVNYAKGKLTSAGANLWPRVTASASYVRSNTLPTFTIGEPMMIPTSFPMGGPSGPPLAPDHLHLWGFPSFEMTSDRTGDIYIAKLEATYPIFTGFRVENGYKASRLQLDSSKSDLAQQRENLVYQIKQAFYSVLLTQEMVKVVDLSYKTMEDHYKQVLALYAEGYVSSLDVAQIEARLSSIKPQQIQAKNGLRMAKLGLATLVNVDPAQDIQMVGQLEYAEEELPSLDQAVKEAMNNRPELKTLSFRKDQTKALVRIAQGGFLPTIALFANYQWNQGQDMPPNDKVWRDGYQAGASASIPIFDGFAAIGETQAAKAQYQQVIWGEQAFKAGIQAEVTSSYLQLLTSREQVDAEKVSVVAAQKNFDAAEKRYREGYVNQLDVLDAETNLTAAQAGYLRAISAYLIARAALDKATGKEV